MADPSGITIRPVDEGLAALGEKYGAFGTQSPQEPPPLSKLGDMVVGAYQGLEGLAKRAFEASRGDLQHLGDHSYEPQSIGPGLEGALMAMTGGVAGTAEGGMALGSGPIRAYHGSPHDFDRFDLSKIGTGEGAQAYGHGLYFADNKGVAKSYREALTNKKVVGDTALEKSAFNIVRNAPHLSDAELAPYVFKPYPNATQEEVTAALTKARAGQQPGNMYEVNINADPAHMLDWDKPLSQQHPFVQEQVKKHMPSIENSEFVSGSGEQLYKEAATLAKIRSGASAPRAAASANLAEAGIPGIKYLDQGSRVNPPRQLWDGKWQVDTGLNSPQFATRAEADAFHKDLLAKSPGTSNWVVFNDRIIDIMRKYGLAGIPAAGAVLAGQDRE